MTAPGHPGGADRRLPGPRADVALAAVGERVVAAVPGRGGAHVLDAAACLLLDLLEDRPTTTDLVAQVAAACDAPASTVLDDVTRAVATLAGAGLLQTGTEPPSTSSDDHPDAWPQPRTACQNTFDAWHSWQPTEVVRAGRHVLGVRTDDGDLAGRLAAHAGAGVVPSPGGVPAHLSLETTSPVASPVGARPLARLSWGCETVATAQRWQDLVPVLAAWVGAVADVDDDVLALVGTAVVVHGGALVLPPGWYGVSAQRRLCRLGHVLPGPAVRLGLDDMRVRGPADRYPVTALLTTGSTDAATVVAQAYSRAVPAPRDPDAALGLLASLVSDAAVVAVDAGADPRSWCGENVIADA